MLGNVLRGSRRYLDMINSVVRGEVICSLVFGITIEVQYQVVSLNANLTTYVPDEMSMGMNYQMTHYHDMHLIRRF